MAKPVVLVTGCSEGGIGNALCIEFHKQGCRVFPSARNEASMRNLAALGMEPIRLDVTDPASIRAAVDTVVAKADRIDIVVNNAGYGLFGPIIEADVAAVHKQFETNVYGALAVCQAAAPYMIRQGGGKLVNIGSISGVTPTPFSGAYAATKAALHAMSDCMRMELKPFSVDVVVVMPGYASSASAIASNFSNNARTSIPLDQLSANSFYASARSFIEKRINSSQAKSTSAEASATDFARATVNAILRRHPPSEFFYGVHSTLMPFVKRWLPTWLVDLILMRMFGLNRLKNTHVVPANKRID